MESVLRVLAMYGVLLLVFRLGGKRTLSQASTFDFLLLLILSETTQQAMVGDDQSLTQAFLLIVTFVLINILLSLVKQRSSAIERIIDDVPMIIVQHGRPLHDRMNKVRIDQEDVLESARESHGLKKLADIRYAVLERDGKISIIPA